MGYTRHRNLYLGGDYQTEAFVLVAIERDRQDEKWGQQDHLPAVWESILGEEAGEVSREVNRIGFGGHDHTLWLAEMVQVAAVAVAAIESELRRREVH